MIAILDIFTLAPDFQTAVQNVHNVTLPFALVACAGGLTMTAVRAGQEKSLQHVWPTILRIALVALFLIDMPAIANATEQLVLSVEQASGVGNGTAFSDYIAALMQKFGVDLSALNGIVPQGPYGNGAGAAPADAPTISTYGYEKPGDPNYDSKSAQGIGAFDFDSAPHSLVPGQSLALSPNLTAGLIPGQQVTVNLANGQTITGIYADRTAKTFDGQTLTRVDIYDPNQQYSALSGVGVTSINAGALPQGGNPIGNFFNGLMHPVETAAIGIFGMAVLFLSYIAVFIWWVMALLQSVLFYSEIAVAPIFVGFLVVRGFESIAKGFLLSFFAICLWPIAFLIVGLVTKFIIALALNTGNNATMGTVNALGMTYFWLVGLAVWVIFGSIFGPLIISKRVVAGASGVADMIVGAHSAAYNAAQAAYRSAVVGASAGRSNGSNGSAPVEVGESGRPNYAVKPGRKS